MSLFSLGVSASAVSCGTLLLLVGALSSLGCVHGTGSRALESSEGAAAGGSRDRPVELGAVAWERDFESAVAAGKKSGKPIFLLFQEVPG